MSCVDAIPFYSLRTQGPDGKLSKQAGVAGDGELWLTKASALLDSLTEDKHCEAVVDVTPELATLRNKARNTANRLRPVCFVCIWEEGGLTIYKHTRDARGSAAVGCLGLVQSLLVQTYNTGPDVSEHLEVRSQCPRSPSHVHEAHSGLP
jgi:hypothetical protein